MEITIAGPAHPYRGGIAALNERLAKQLITEGHTVRIVSFTLQYPKILFPGKTQFTTDEANLDFQVTREINSINPLSWIRTGNRIKRSRPDILLVRFWMPFFGMCMGTICRLAKKNKHTRVIALVDNIIPHEKRTGDNLMINYFVKNADGFIAMSKSVLDDLNFFDKHKPKKFTPHPVYDHYGEVEDRITALKKLNLDPNYRYILFFGFIRDYKGLDLLIEAVAGNFFRENNIKLIVAGEFYSDEKSCRELIKDRRLEDMVILKSDYIPNSEVQNYFNAADIIAQPYRSATQSGVTQIAYHFNKPALVTNVGGLPEIIPHLRAGYVVKPDIGEIRDALTDFFKNSRLNNFIQNILVEKERFKWDKMTDTIFKLYDELN